MASRQGIVAALIDDLLGAMARPRDVPLDVEKREAGVADMKAMRSLRRARCWFEATAFASCFARARTFTRMRRSSRWLKATLFTCEVAPEKGTGGLEKVCSEREERSGNDEDETED